MRSRAAVITKGGYLSGCSIFLWLNCSVDNNGNRGIVICISKLSQKKINNFIILLVDASPFGANDVQLYTKWVQYGRRPYVGQSFTLPQRLIIIP